MVYVLRGHFPPHGILKIPNGQKYGKILTHLTAIINSQVKRREEMPGPTRATQPKTPKKAELWTAEN